MNEMFKFTLAFPILSIGDFHLPPMISVDIFISAFLEANIFRDCNACNFVMVHPKIHPNNHYQVNYPEMNKLHDLEIMSGGKFRFLSGDLCSLKSIGGIEHPVIIVHPTNHRFNEKGGWLNQRIHEYVGKELKSLSTTLYPKKKKGIPYIIPLPEENSFRQQEGCHYILQILTPNLNPALPDCETSLENAKLILKQCYLEIFLSFHKIISDNLGNNNIITSVQQPDNIILTSSNVVDETHQGFKESNNNNNKTLTTVTTTTTSTSNNNINIDTSPPVSLATTSTIMSSNTILNDIQFHEYNSPTYSYSNNNTSTATTNTTAAKGIIPQSGNWKNSLYQYITSSSTSGTSSNNTDNNNNAHQKSQIFYETDDIIVIYDAYPKSRIHLLLLPKLTILPPIRSILDITTTSSDHTSIINKLYNLGNKIRNSLQIQAAAQGWRVRMGFHAVPSLQPLHMHLISSDFHSDALKVVNN